MTKRSLAVLFATFALFVNFANAQSETEAAANQEKNKLSAAEEAEAREVAHRFQTNLTESNSIIPLIDEFGARGLVTNFKKGIVEQLGDGPEIEKEEMTEEQRRDLVTNRVFLALDDATWDRFYRDFLELQYLMLAGSAVESETQEDMEFDGMSAEALAVMRSNPQTAVLFDSSKDDLGFRNTEELRASLASLEAGEVIMRADLQRKLALADSTADDELAATDEEPKIHLCDVDPAKLGQPAGTRLIDIELSVGLIVTLAREDGNLRVVSIERSDD